MQRPGDRAALVCLRTAKRHTAKSANTAGNEPEGVATARGTETCNLDMMGSHWHPKNPGDSMAALCRIAWGRGGERPARTIAPSCKYR